MRIRGVAVFALSIALAVFWGVASPAQGCNLLWQPANPLPFAQRSGFKLAYGNGTFVAVNGSGLVYTSPDGQDWRRVCAGTDNDFIDVAWGNGRFVAISHGYDVSVNTVHISEDGVRWREIPFPYGPAVYLSTIRFVGGYFCAFNAGNSPTLFVSPDGVDWSYVAFPENLNGLAYGSAKYVVVSGNHYYVSPDMSEWMAFTYPVPTYAYGISYGQGHFVVLAENEGLHFSLTSPDAVNWSEAPLQYPISAICFGAEGIVGIWNANNPPFYWSQDGITWSQSSVPGTGGVPSDLIYAAGRFVASVGNQVWTSTDGSDWRTASIQGISVPSARVRYLKPLGEFMAVGFDLIASSPDGKQWSSTRVERYYVTLSDITTGDGVLVAVGTSNYAGGIFVSSDGTDWTDVSPGNPEAFLGVAYGNHTFVAVGRYGVIYTSPDGVTWTRRDTGFRTDLKEVAFGNGRFVAAGEGETTLSSIDGVNWAGQQNVDSHTDGQYSSVVFIGGRFWINSPYRVSTDGITWTDLQDATGPSGGVLQGAGGYIFSVSGARTRSTSGEDGMTWETPPPGMRTQITGMASNGSVYVAVDENNVAYYAEACYPEVTSVTPDTLSLSGGETVTIKGAHLSGTTAVTFGGVPAAGFTVVSDGEISAVAPSQSSAGMVDVTVTTPGGTSLLTAGSRIAAGPRPLITSVRKRGNPFRLLVTGENFDSAVQVTVGDQPAPKIKVKSAGLIKLKGGKYLKWMCPKGQPIQITVTNLRSGIPSKPFTYTR